MLSSQVFARILVVGAALLALHYLRRQRRQRQCCRFVVASSSVARRFSPAIKGLIECSFPEDLADEDTRAAMEEDALSVLCGFHDVDACEWLLAIQGAHVVGLAMLVKYHDTLFVSSLCVLPEHRGCGIGSRLMRSASSYAEAHGLGALSGSVKAAHQASERRTEQLVQFYMRLGGTVDTGNCMASPQSPPPQQRLRAPSGRPTSKGIPAPERLDSKSSIITCTDGLR